VAHAPSKTPVAQAPGMCRVPLFFIPIFALRAGMGTLLRAASPLLAPHGCSLKTGVEKSLDTARKSAYATSSLTTLL
jgi:hypothetical protein